VANAERVLLIEPQGEPGGMWHYAGCLSDALSGAGLDITLATISPHEPLKVEHDVHVCSIGTRSRQASPLPMRLAVRAANHLERSRRLHQLVHALRPAIVHLNNPLSKLDFLNFRRLRSMGPRFVYTAHDPKPDTGVTWFDWARFREADAILVHSTKAEMDLTAGGIAKSKIARIHHGNYLKFCPDAELPRDEAKRLLALPSSARVLLFFGTILPYKGLDVLLEAFSLLSTQRSDLYMVVAGEPLEDFTPYRRAIERFDLGPRTILDLRYIPFDEFPKYFLSADVVVFPYRHIYQSGVLQLAYGFGRPVAATNVGGLGELIAEDRTGVVAPAVDPRALADVVLRLLSDPAGAEEMGKRGRYLAETKYAWPAIAQKVIDVYRTVTAFPVAGEPRSTRALVR
jgi:D-inositol-3-phosphate glycosyltransferase